ncbi:hypothetical protein CMUS01_10320 [Colletotrichum musicola]|uniref:Uncharacterized protein n=1 Tax=Colletotrichum musicola TaxID=2175873 RepID=A0A8H6N9D2_9PEZI|nr:hypothetical protein CMUS01_10320 [Colletotrichum musicola]
MTTKAPQANGRPDEAAISRWQNALKFTHGREEAAARILHWRRKYHHYRKVTEAEWDAARARYAYDEEGFDLETFEYLENWQNIYMAEEDQTWKPTQVREQTNEELQQQQHEQHRHEQLQLQQMDSRQDQRQREEQENPPIPAANWTTPAPAQTTSQPMTSSRFLVVVEPPLTMEAAERTMPGREGIKTSHAFFDRSTSPPTVNIAQVLEIDQAAKREILYYLDAVDPHFQPTFLPLEALQPGYREPMPRRRSLSTKKAQTEAARAAWETAMQHAESANRAEGRR